MGFKCKANINLYKFVIRTPIPCYSRFLIQFHTRSFEHHMHWFCFHDLSHYVNGTLRKYAIVRLLVPIVWPIQEGIDLSLKGGNNFRRSGVFL
jgi:hypothetical protein